jgi:hypothetical protein
MKLKFFEVLFVVVLLFVATGSVYGQYDCPPPPDISSLDLDICYHYEGCATWSVDYRTVYPDFNGNQGCPMVVCYLIRECVIPDCPATRQIYIYHISIPEDDPDCLRWLYELFPLLEREGRRDVIDENFVGVLINACYKKLSDLLLSENMGDLTNCKPPCEELNSCSVSFMNAIPTCTSICYWTTTDGGGHVTNSDLYFQPCNIPEGNECCVFKINYCFCQADQKVRVFYDYLANPGKSEDCMNASIPKCPEGIPVLYDYGCKFLCQP